MRIPAQVRRALGIRPGVELTLAVEAGVIRVIPRTPREVAVVHGMIVVTPTMPERLRRKLDISTVVSRERDRWTDWLPVRLRPGDERRARRK